MCIPASETDVIMTAKIQCDLTPKHIIIAFMPQRSISCWPIHEVKLSKHNLSGPFENRFDGALLHLTGLMVLRLLAGSARLLGCSCLVYLGPTIAKPCMTWT